MQFFLSPSRVITAVIIAIIFDAFSAKCKGVCFCYVFRVVCSVAFSLFGALSTIEQLPEM